MILSGPTQGCLGRTAFFVGFLGPSMTNSMHTFSTHTLYTWLYLLYG